MPTEEEQEPEEEAEEEKVDDSLDRDKRRLVEFVGALSETLEVALFERPDLFGSHAGPFHAVWPQIRERFHPIEEPLQGRHRGKPLTDEERSDLDARLRDHGLTGAELSLKLDIFSSLLLAFLDELERRDTAEEYWKTWAARLERPEPSGGVLRRAAVGRVRGVLAGARRVLKGGLRQVLGAGDMVFESLGDALSFLPGPKAAAAGVKEFKDAADVVLTQPDEAELPPRRRVRPPTPQGEQPGVPKSEALRRRATGLRSSPAA